MGALNTTSTGCTALVKSFGTYVHTYVKRYGG